MSENSQKGAKGICFLLTGREGGVDVVTPLGPGDGLQPDVVLGGASQLSHAVGGCCRAQHHLLGQPKRTKTKLTIQHTLGLSACVCVGGLRTLITPSAEEKVRV